MKPEKSFEASLKELEEIVERLEAGDLPLEESLELFERGVRLSRDCQQRLDAAERRVEILLKNQDGTFSTIELDELEQ
ncbi:MAG TPA: exodeoxyribonuclease VII small subunit [Blastocatellia bacterium]|nr:exodeoxyribonuclease VII small subunit [Blastocatellia bacterium]